MYTPSNTITVTHPTVSNDVDNKNTPYQIYNFVAKNVPYNMVLRDIIKYYPPSIPQHLKDENKLSGITANILFDVGSQQMFLCATKQNPAVPTENLQPTAGIGGAYYGDKGIAILDCVKDVVQKQLIGMDNSFFLKSTSSLEDKKLSEFINKIITGEKFTCDVGFHLSTGWGGFGMLTFRFNVQSSEQELQSIVEIVKNKKEQCNVPNFKVADYRYISLMPVEQAIQSAQKTAPMTEKEKAVYNPLYNDKVINELAKHGCTGSAR